MRALGGGVLMDLTRRLEDVYMFTLQVGQSRSPCALTGSRQNAFIRASRDSPWERAVCQQRGRLPTVRPTLLHERRRKRAIPTLAEPPPPGLRLWTDTGGSVLSKKGRTITNMPSWSFNISRSRRGGERSVCARASSCSTPLHCGCRAQASWRFFYSTLGVNWAFYSKFILKAGNSSVFISILMNTSENVYCMTVHVHWANCMRACVNRKQICLLRSLLLLFFFIFSFKLVWGTQLYDLELKSNKRYEAFLNCRFNCSGCTCNLNVSRNSVLAG